ncbi:MAG: DUF2892 domain-containing protein [Elusimicrobiota bacterium]
MKKNMGNLDRGIRIYLAILIALPMLLGAIHGALGIILGIIAVIFLITSIAGFCPLYAIIGMSTAGKTKETLEAPAPAEHTSKSKGSAVPETTEPVETETTGTPEKEDIQ